MSGALPTGLSGRLLALGITILVLAMAWFAAAAPLIDWYADRADRLDQRRVLARRMEAVAQTLPELRQAAAPGATQPQGGGLAASGPATSLIGGATDAVAAATLQQLLQDMAGRTGASVSSAETLPATQAGAYRRIGLHVSVAGRWSVLVRLLEAVDQATPRMLVDDLQFHAPRLVVQPPDPPMDAGFTLFAFRAVGALPR